MSIIIIIIQFISSPLWTRVRHPILVHPFIHLDRIHTPTIHPTPAEKLLALFVTAQQHRLFVIILTNRGHLLSAAHHHFALVAQCLVVAGCGPTASSLKLRVLTYSRLVLFTPASVLLWLRPRCRLLVVVIGVVCGQPLAAIVFAACVFRREWSEGGIQTVSCFSISFNFTSAGTGQWYRGMQSYVYAIHTIK